MRPEGGAWLCDRLALADRDFLCLTCCPKGIWPLPSFFAFLFFLFLFSSPYNQTGKGYLTLGAVESRHDLMRENCFTAKYPLFSDQAKNLTYVTKSSPIDIFSRHFGLMIIQIIPFDISLMTKKRRCTSLTPKICIIFLSSVTDCPCHLPLFQLTSRLRTNESIDLQLLVVFIL